MSHATRPTVANELGRVEPCACGGSNLHLGIITLHIDRRRAPAFVELARGVERQLSAAPPGASGAPVDGGASGRGRRRRPRPVRGVRVLH